MPTGAETPVAAYPVVTVDIATPVDENSLAELLPELPSHTLPNPSNEIDVGVDKPPPLNGLEPTFAPAALSSVSVEFPEFAIQAWPLLSMAIAEGIFSAPAV